MLYSMGGDGPKLSESYNDGYLQGYEVACRIVEDGDMTLENTGSFRSEIRGLMENDNPFSKAYWKNGFFDGFRNYP